MEPVLQPDGGREGEMPTPEAVGAVADVAARAACCVPECAAVLSSTAERLLSISEECVELALELGIGGGAAVAAAGRTHVVSHVGTYSCAANSHKA